jgi:hypothetical protein
MKFFLTIIIFLLSVCSCRVEHDWINWELIYTNNTDHSIQIKQYYDGALVENISILKRESTVYYLTKEDQQGIFVKCTDSLFVIYDDSIAVRHYPTDNEYVLKKNLCFTSSYEVVSTGKNKCRGEYTFTEEDYQEALEIYLKEHHQ